VEILRAGLGVVEVEQRRLMDIVLRETERLDALIGDFLHYARPAVPKPEAVELAVLAAELREMYEAARPRGVTVRLAVEPGLRVLADPDQLRQLLWNLVRNADQAMPETGELAIEARTLPAQEAPGDDRRHEEAGGCAWVEITVSDTGHGIAPELLDRVFDPFFTTKPRGSGLGLAMVHRIVEANEGSVSVESEPGKGARFRVRLPAAGRSRAAASVGREEERG
jgi:two-component system sensor histidine kinase PilS (NtrC family)